MHKPSARQRISKAQARSKNAHRTEALAAQKALEAYQSSHPQSRTSMFNVYSLRRELLNQQDISESLLFNDNSALGHYGFAHLKGNQRPGTTILGAAMAVALARNYKGTSHEFRSTIIEASRDFPNELTGQLGAVCVLGSCNNPGPKYIAWQFHETLNEEIQNEQSAVVDRLATGAISSTPHLSFAATRSMTQAREWQQELAAVTPHNTNVRLGRLISYPVTVTL